jgi:hypothetical protein
LFRKSPLYLVDSDFDTEDETYGDDIEEIIGSGSGEESHLQTMAKLDQELINLQTESAF